MNNKIKTNDGDHTITGTHFLDNVIIEKRRKGKRRARSLYKF